MQTPSTIRSAAPELPPSLACSPTRRTVRFCGRVQGVGFRYTARNVAMQHDVCGYVRNLADGSVELVLEGAESEADRVVDEIRRKMSGFVRGVTLESSPATGEFEQFAIRH
jgi:acylphosphatase